MQPGKKWEELTIQDDFLFKKVMKNRRICTKMLEKILHIKIGKITYHEEEKSIDMRLESKGVRLDVYVQDEGGTVFNIEMQTTNYRSELKLRGRYYQGMIDQDLMEKGLAESSKRIIGNMLKQQLDCSQIAILTGMPEKEVQAVVAELRTGKN
jgi:hypothetical protein